jgi:choline kinase
MRAVILAAGTGSRLGEITKARTKGMVPVAGTKLIDHLFHFLDLEFFDEIIIVGGYCFEDLRDHVEAQEIPNVKVIQNSEYLKGNIFTLLTGLDEFKGDSFLITNVDHIYPPAMFRKMKESFGGITAMCDSDRKLTHDDMKVKLSADGKHVEMISKELSEYNCGYIGMTYVDVSREGVYREAAAETVKSVGEKAVVENILQLLAGEKRRAPGICDLSGFGWFEVDDENDLRKAEKGLENIKNIGI